MDLLVVLSVLRRRRLVVALGAVLAVGAGLLVGYQLRLSPFALIGRQHRSGIASARVLIDTEQSQLVTAAPEGTENLMDRAALLADSVTTRHGNVLAARAAGLRARDVIVYDPSTLQPVVGIPMAMSAAEAAAPAAPYLVTVGMDPELPIVSLDATAPTAAGAARAVNGAITALREIATPPTAGQRPLVSIDAVMPTYARAVRSGPGLAVAVIAGVVCFLFWCFSLVVASGLRGAWRRTLGPAVA